MHSVHRHTYIYTDPSPPCSASFQGGSTYLFMCVIMCAYSEALLYELHVSMLRWQHDLRADGQLPRQPAQQAIQMGKGMPTTLATPGQAGQANIQAAGNLMQQLQGTMHAVQMGQMAMMQMMEDNRRNVRGLLQFQIHQQHNWVNTYIASLLYRRHTPHISPYDTPHGLFVWPCWNFQYTNLLQWVHLSLTTPSPTMPPARGGNNNNFHFTSNPKLAEEDHHPLQHHGWLKK